MGRNVRRRFTLYLAVALTGAITASDWPLGFADAFWARHSLFTGIVSGLVLLFFAAAVVEHLVREREERQWRQVANTAFLEFGGLLLLEFRLLRRLTGTERYEHPRPLQASDDEFLTETLLARYSLMDLSLQASLAELADDDQWAEFAHERIQELQDQGREKIARWSPIMIGSNRLADVLSDVTSALDAATEVQVPLIRLARSGTPIADVAVWARRWEEVADEALALGAKLNPYVMGLNSHKGMPDERIAIPVGSS